MNMLRLKNDGKIVLINDKTSGIPQSEFVGFITMFLILHCLCLIMTDLVEKKRSSLMSAISGKLQKFLRK